MAPPRDRDFQLLEGYHQAVSAEFVRVALLGIGAIGLLYTLERDKQPTGLAALGPKVSFGIAIFVLGISAGLGVFHRYFSTDSMAFQISLDREKAKQPPDQSRIAGERAARDWAFKASKLTLFWSAVTLAAGSMSLGVGFVFVVFSLTRPVLVR